MVIIEDNIYYFCMKKYFVILETIPLTLWAYSADDKLLIVFLFFPENRLWHFMWIAREGNSWHEMSASFLEKKENISKSCLLKFVTQNAKS